MIDDRQDAHSYYSEYPDVHLEILRGRARIRTRPVRAPVYLIGRANDCDLVLGDPQFPDLHTYLFVTQDGVTARHLGQGPGLHVADRPQQCANLRHGDLLQMGNYEFRIHIEFPPRTGGDDRRRTDDAHDRGDQATRESHVHRSRKSERSPACNGGHQLRLFLGHEATEYVQQRASA